MMTAAGMSAYLGVAGLGKASELAAVIGGFVGLAGLVIAAYGVIRAHRDAMTPVPQGLSATQSVEGTAAHTVTQVQGVAGSVRIGPSSQAVPPASSLRVPPTTHASPSSASPRDLASGEQTVTSSTVTGAVTQVGGVGGDVDIDQ
jgi:hypothetical protein